MRKSGFGFSAQSNLCRLRKLICAIPLRPPASELQPGSGGHHYSALQRLAPDLTGSARNRSFEEATFQRPSLTRGRSHFVYHQGTARIPEGTSPSTKDRSYTISAKIDAPEGGGNGVIVTQSGRFAGWGLVIINGSPIWAYKRSQVPVRAFASKDPTSSRRVGTRLLLALTMTARLARSAQVGLSLYWSMVLRSEKQQSNARFPTFIRSMRHSTSARTMARRSLKTTPIAPLFALMAAAKRS
jgi:hypothetical protein